MSDSAYHYEALRKARILERKNQALRLSTMHRTQNVTLQETCGDYANFTTLTNNQQLNQPAPSRRCTFVVDHPMKTRLVDNTLVDQVAPLIHPPPPKRQMSSMPPRPRVPHFKV